MIKNEQTFVITIEKSDAFKLKQIFFSTAVS